jgi:hypothetical protein
MIYLFLIFLKKNCIFSVSEISNSQRLSSSSKICTFLSTIQGTFTHPLERGAHYFSDMKRSSALANALDDLSGASNNLE